MKSTLLTNLAYLLLATLLFPQVASAQTSPCDVVQIVHNPNLPVIWSPDSSKYLVNVQDTAGVFQIYVGNAGDPTPTCISLNYPWSFLRPWSQRNKLQVQWHASGDYIICGVEKEFYNELLYVPYSLRLGFLQSGIWMEIWAVTPNGSTWHNLAYNAHGFTGPAFTPDGTKCAWADAQDSSNLAEDIFGLWKLQMADFVVNNGVPSFSNMQNITPAGTHWVEPGNFAPDGVSLLVSADIGIANAEGQDQFIINTNTGGVINLTNSPQIWDEHGVFSPDGEKVLFMSSYPYQADTNAYHTLSLKTEFMLINVDGSGLQQLTHFRTPGYLESSPGIAATGFWTRDGSTIYAQSLIFPDYDNWIIQFYGNCGNATTSINEVSPFDRIHLYPNPVQNILHVDTDLDLSKASVTIFNALGQTIKHIVAMDGSTISIDTDALEAGIYSLQIQAGKQHLNKMFIKHD